MNLKFERPAPAHISTAVREGVERKDVETSLDVMLAEVKRQFLDSLNTAENPFSLRLALSAQDPSSENTVIPEEEFQGKMLPAITVSSAVRAEINALRIPVGMEEPKYRVEEALLAIALDAAVKGKALTANELSEKTGYISAQTKMGYVRRLIAATWRCVGTPQKGWAFRRVEVEEQPATTMKFSVRRGHTVEDMVLGEESVVTLTQWKQVGKKPNFSRTKELPFPGSETDMLLCGIILEDTRGGERVFSLQELINESGKGWGTVHTIMRMLIKNGAAFGISVERWTPFGASQYENQFFRVVFDGLGEDRVKSDVAPPDVDISKHPRKCTDQPKK